MNKTVITVTSIITFGFLLISHWLIQSRERVEGIKSQERIQLETETRDRFTVCVQTVMSEARQSGKPVSANEAKDICVHTKAEKQDKED